MTKLIEMIEAREKVCREAAAWPWDNNLQVVESMSRNQRPNELAALKLAVEALGKQVAEDTEQFECWRGKELYEEDDGRKIYEGDSEVYGYYEGRAKAGRAALKEIENLLT